MKTCSTSTSRSVTNRSTLKVVRQNKGTEASSVQDLKNILDKKKKKELEQKQLPTSKQQPPQRKDSDDCLLVEPPEDDFFKKLASSEEEPVDQRVKLSSLQSILPNTDEEEEISPSSLQRDPSSSGLVEPSGDKYCYGFERKRLSYLMQLNRKVDDLTANVARLLLHLLPHEKIIKRPPSMPETPLKSLGEVDKMESYLNNDTLPVVAMFFSAGVSSDPSQECKTVFRLLPNVMLNRVAKHFSFEGRQGKQGFKSLSLFKAVQGAVLLKIAGSDLTETKRAVQKWLSDAPWRSQEENNTSRRQSKQ